MKVKFGAILLQLLIKTVKLEDNKPVFQHIKQRIGFNKDVGMIRLTSAAMSYLEDQQCAWMPRFLPMVIPPRPWKSPFKSPYIMLKVSVMRCKFSQFQFDVLKRGNLASVYEALNYLGSIPWRIDVDQQDVIREVTSSFSPSAGI